MVIGHMLTAGGLAFETLDPWRVGPKETDSFLTKKECADFEGIFRDFSVLGEQLMILKDFQKLIS